MIYKRRHPEKTEYYRVIEANFEAFERNYSELFEEDYGYLRKDIMPAIYAYLDCGIPENGVERVRCGCGSDLPQLCDQKIDSVCGKSSRNHQTVSSSSYDLYHP